MVVENDDGNLALLRPSSVEDFFQIFQSKKFDKSRDENQV